MVDDRRHHKDETCALCGRNPAAGFAVIDGRRYCHASPGVTCYMQATWDAGR